MAKDMVKNRTGGSQASAAELYDFMKKVLHERSISCACLAQRRPETERHRDCEDHVRKGCDANF